MGRPSRSMRAAACARVATSLARRSRSNARYGSAASPTSRRRSTVAAPMDSSVRSASISRAYKSAATHRAIHVAWRVVSGVTFGFPSRSLRSRSQSAPARHPRRAPSQARGRYAGRSAAAPPRAPGRKPQALHEPRPAVKRRGRVLRRFATPSRLRAGARPVRHPLPRASGRPDRGPRGCRRRGVAPAAACGGRSRSDGRSGRARCEASRGPPPMPRPIARRRATARTHPHTIQAADAGSGSRA